MSRTRRIALATTFGLALFAATFLLALRPVPTVGAARGQALGEANRVLLVDAERGVSRLGRLDADGRYEVEIPETAEEPRLVLESADGASASIAIRPPRGEVALAPLAVWHATATVERRGRTLRFTWAPIPAGDPGFPRAPRYSLLFSYPRADGGRGEASIPTREPHHELDVVALTELLEGIAPETRRLALEVRCFQGPTPDGEGETGLWSGPPTEIELPQANGP